MRFAPRHGLRPTDAGVQPRRDLTRRRLFGAVRLPVERRRFIAARTDPSRHLVHDRDPAVAWAAAGEAAAPAGPAAAAVPEQAAAGDQPFPAAVAREVHRIGWGGRDDTID